MPRVRARIPKPSKNGIPPALVKDALDYLDHVVEALVETFDHTEGSAPLVLRVVNWHQLFTARMQPYIGKRPRVSPRTNRFVDDPKVLTLVDYWPRARSPKVARYLSPEQEA